MSILINNQKGSAILIALSLIIMLTMIGMFAVNRSNTDVDLAFNKVHSDESFYIAEAGAKRAVYELKQDYRWRTGFDSVSFSGGRYSVAVLDSNIDPALYDTMIVLSDGWTSNALANIEITLWKKPFNPFLYAMFGEDTLAIKNGFNTDSYNSDSGYAASRLDSAGSAGSNGIIQVDLGAHVGGDVLTSMTGGADVHPAATVTGTIADDVPKVEIPPVPDAEFDWAKANNAAPGGLSGSYTYDMATGALSTNGELILDDGIYYFSSIDMKTKASITVKPGAKVQIYVSDFAYFKNDGDVNPGGNPSDFLLISQGPVYLMNGGSMSATVYAPESVVDMKNSGDFFGSVVGKEVKCSNSALFHYDRALSKFKKDEWLTADVVGWREL